MMLRRSHSIARRGFTLIESMATVSVLAVLGSAASFLILDAVDGYMEAASSAQLHAELSIALDRAMRELRAVELDAGAGVVAPNIVSTQADGITWQDSGSDQYQLVLSGTDLQLQVDGGALAVLMSDVTGFSVTTYDEDNADLGAPLAGAACDPIRRVQLVVTASRSGVTEKLRSKAFLRCTMDGST